MQANVKWVEGDTFIGLSNSGHNVVLMQVAIALRQAQWKWF